MPKNSHSFSDVYTSVDEYTKSRYNMLRQVLKNLDTDTFKKDDLKKLVEESKKIFERDIHILDILWLNGILGYVNNEQVYFYMNHNSISTCLDQNYDEYVLRSCMIDALDIKNYDYHLTSASSQVCTRGSLRTLKPDVQTDFHDMNVC